MVTESLAGRLSRGQEIISAWTLRNDNYDFAAWTKSDWSGAIKPSTDVLKTAKGYKEQISMGVITRDRASRELTGMKYSKVVRRLAKENQQLAEAMEPFAAAGEPETDPTVEVDVDAIAEAVASIMEAKAG